MIIRYSFVFTLVSPRRSFESFRRTERSIHSTFVVIRNVSILSLSLSLSSLGLRSRVKRREGKKERTSGRRPFVMPVDFRKRILSAFQQKKTRKDAKEEEDTTTPTTTFKEARKNRNRILRNNNALHTNTTTNQEEEARRREPNHFVQYASPKTAAAPRELPFHDARIERERLRPTFYYTSEEDFEWKKRQKRTNEYIQKPVVSSESRRRNIFSRGHHRDDEDELNDILTTPIVGRKVFVREEERKRKKALWSSSNNNFCYYGSAGKYSSRKEEKEKEEEEEFRFRSNEENENTLDTFARAAKASREAYATSSSPGFGKPALTFNRAERLLCKQRSISSRHTPLGLVKQASATREELVEIERGRKDNESDLIDLTEDARDAEEEVIPEVIDLTSDNPPSSSYQNKNIEASNLTPSVPAFANLRRTKSATPKMGAAASSGRSSGGIKDEINKARSADLGSKKRFSRRKKHIDIFGPTARRVVESAPEGEQLSQYKAQVAKFALESFSNDEENENQNETQRKLVEELDNKDERDKTKVTTPKTVTTVTKMGGTHTKFNTSPLSPTELKLEASSRAAKRATGIAAAEEEAEKDPLRAQLEALRLEQKKRENLRVKATEDRKKAEEEAEEEAIVQKKAKEVDIFDQLPTAEEDERIDEAYDAAESVDIACAKLPGQGVVPLKGKDIHTLAPVTWLNDECVNFTLGILGRRERERCGPKGHPRCHFFNTFFLNKLFQDAGVYEYNKVRRWTTEKKVGYLPIKCEKVIIPVHQGVHWVLAVVDLKRKVVSYYDSLLGRDRDVVRNLIKWVVDEAENKLNEKWDITEWKEEYPSEIPRQMNGSDCGMFMLNYARNVASFTDEDLANNAFTFHQKDMVNLRRRLVLEVLKIGMETSIDT